jgi:hypothetical protein
MNSYKKHQEKIYLELVETTLDESFKSLALAGALTLGAAGAVKGYHNNIEHAKASQSAIQNLVNIRNVEGMENVLDMLDVQAYAADLDSAKTVLNIADKLSDSNIFRNILQQINSMNDSDRTKVRNAFVALRNSCRDSNKRESYDALLRRF